MNEFGYHEKMDGEEIFRPFRQIVGGWHIKDLRRDEFRRPRCVHVMEMLDNFRIVRSVGDCDSPMSFYDRGWCYRGRSKGVFALATLEALIWDGEDDTNPLRWNKNAYTGESYEPPGYLSRGS